MNHGRQSNKMTIDDPDVVAVFHDPTIVRARWMLRNENPAILSFGSKSCAFRSTICGREPTIGAAQPGRPGLVETTCAG
jgi:hypothetical protein